MAEKEVYVFFNKDSYKTSKASILETKIELIKLQKRIKKIKAIRARKKKSVVLLKRYFDRLKNRFEPLYDHIGKDDLPKELKREIKVLKKTSNKKEKKKIVVNDVPPKTTKIIKEDNFENELSRIQEQLKRLGV